MKYLKTLTLLGLVTATSMMLASSASATTITSPAGALYTNAIKAEAENFVEFKFAPFELICASSKLEGNVESHGANVTAVVKLTNLSFAECNLPINVLKPGTLEIHTKTANADGDGTVTWTGAEITINGPMGFNCIIRPLNTDVGTLTGSKTTKNTATLDIEPNAIPRNGHSAFCGPFAEWKGNYIFTTPDYLDVD